MRRAAAVFLVVVIAVLGSSYLFGQSSNASITGVVTDPSKAIIVGAKVTAINDGTNVRYSGVTNRSGSYYIPALPPGTYRVEVENTGFTTVLKPGVVLHVQDTVELNFEMAVGSTTESVTVQAGGTNINTTDASVSTVIDRNFVENLPLNGRSFNTLLQLTPGVVIAPTASFAPGQFTINGQRTNSNYFSVDGVSANFSAGVNVNLGQYGTGGAQGFNVFGGTSSLVSVDAMQEFRVQTSTFAPEYGSTPGGQVAITSRSGTNALRGAIFEYFRNDVLDANDWFANHLPGRPHAALRQNDFGGVLGGPIVRNKTFFFLSYEGLELRQPKSSTIVVPSVGVRSQGTPSINALLNSYPVPNGLTLSSTAAQFSGVYSDSGNLHAGSVRIDHNLSSRISIFGRYNYSPSNSKIRAASLNSVTTNNNTVQTVTLGSVMQFAQNLLNNFRINFSSQSTTGDASLDNFGGAVPFSEALIVPTPFRLETSLASLFFVGLSGGGAPLVGNSYNNREHQFNITDDLSWTKGHHQLKAGFDWRDLRLANGPRISFTYISVPGITATLGGTFPSANLLNLTGADVLFRSFSLFGQDTWRLTNRMIVTYGLRWDVNPAPSGLNGSLLQTFDNIDDLSRISPAPPGTDLWKTTYRNVAPRVGFAYRVGNNDSTVIRVGWGVFYDLGTGRSGSLGGSYPHFLLRSLSNVPFPLQNATTVVPTQASGPPYSSLILFSRDLKLPYSQQWNLAVEKSFGSKQAASLTYVGQVGRRLLFQEDSNGASPLVSTVFVTRNGASSSYNALQAQFRRTVTTGLQALLSYTLSHSIDNVSDDVTFGIPASKLPLSANRGSSDFDVRHNFSGSVNYTFPKPAFSHFLNAIVGEWGVAGIAQLRSGFPLSVVTSKVILDPTLASSQQLRVDRIAGVPLYLDDSSAPGGQRLNPAAFTLQTTQRQGTLGRNAVPGFGASQVDASLYRNFKLTERWALQFRTDAFNLLNHPNFGNPVNNFDLGTFGRSTQMLNSALGGLSPLYQLGGPRSLQLSLRLSF